MFHILHTSGNEEIQCISYVRITRATRFEEFENNASVPVPILVILIYDTTSAALSSLKPIIQSEAKSSLLVDYCVRYILLIRSL